MKRLRTKTKVITLANQKAHRQCIGPIRTDSKRGKTTPNDSLLVLVLHLIGLRDFRLITQRSNAKPVILFETQVAPFTSFALQPERLYVAKVHIIVRVTTLKTHLVEISNC